MGANLSRAAGIGGLRGGRSLLPRGSDLQYRGTSESRVVEEGRYKPGGGRRRKTLSAVRFLCLGSGTGCDVRKGGGARALFTGSLRVVFMTLYHGGGKSREGTPRSRYHYAGRGDLYSDDISCILVVAVDVSGDMTA